MAEKEIRKVFFSPQICRKSQNLPRPKGIPNGLGLTGGIRFLVRRLTRCESLRNFHARCAHNSRHRFSFNELQVERDSDSVHQNNTLIDGLLIRDLSFDEFAQNFQRNNKFGRF